MAKRGGGGGEESVLKSVFELGSQLDLFGEAFVDGTKLVRPDFRFQTKFQVGDYSPHQLEIKVYRNAIKIYGCREPLTKDSTKREFTKKITIPPEVHPQDIQFTLSKDGVLTVYAEIEEEEGDADAEAAAAAAQSKKEEEERSSTAQVNALALQLEGKGRGGIVIRPTHGPRRTPPGQPPPEYKDDNKNFEINVDMKDEFGVDGIQINITDNIVKIVGRQDNRSMFKQFSLPRTVVPETAKSTLSPNGMLTVVGELVGLAGGPPPPPPLSAAKENIELSQDCHAAKSKQFAKKLETALQSKRTLQLKATDSVSSTDSAAEIEEETIQPVTPDPSVMANPFAPAPPPPPPPSLLAQQQQHKPHMQKFEAKVPIPCEYKPEELQIRITRQGIVVEGRIVNERTKTEFTKRVPLPPGVIHESIASCLSRNKDGSQTLTLNALVQGGEEGGTELKPLPSKLQHQPPQQSHNLNKEDGAFEDVTRQLQKRDDGSLEMVLNAPGFAPEQFQVVISDNNVVRVSGKREGAGGGPVEFHKKFTIPPGISPDSLITSYDPSGALKISAGKTQGAANPSAKQPAAGGATASSATGIPIKTKLVSPEALLREHNFENAKAEVYPLSQLGKLFERLVPVLDFKPKDIEVRMSYNIKGFNWVVVEGKEEACAETNWKSKQFAKMFTVPPGVKLEHISCVYLGERKELKVTAPIGQP